MNETKIIFGVLPLLGFLIGIFLLFLKTDRTEALQVSKLIPGASLYQGKHKGVRENINGSEGKHKGVRATLS
jgi:hypothetical protein